MYNQVVSSVSRCALIAGAALSLLLPATAAHALTPPVLRAATGGGLICPEGLAYLSPYDVRIADRCANKLFTYFSGTHSLAELRGTGGTNPNEDGFHPEDIPHPSSVAQDATYVVYFTDDPATSIAHYEGRVRHFSLEFATAITTYTFAASAVGHDLVGLSINPLSGGPTGYFAAREEGIVRKFSGNNATIQVAGNGSPTGTPVTAGSDPMGGSIGTPSDTAVDPASDANVYFSTHFDSAPDLAYKVANAGNTATDSIAVVAGGGVGPALGDGGSPTSAWLLNPTSIAMLADGGFLIYDGGHARIRRVNGARTSISTIVGNGTTGLAADGTPADVAPLQPSGDVVVTDDGIVFSQPDSAAIQVVPAVAVVSGPPALTNSRSATLGLASWDSAATFTCKLDQGASGQPCGPYSNLPDGQHTVQLKATTDNLTRISGDLVTKTWTVDATAPAGFDLVSPEDGAGAQHVSTTFAWRPAADALSGIDRYELYIDDAKVGEVKPTDCTDVCSLTPPALTETTHTWQVKAFDKAGNSTASAKRTLTVSVPPVAGLVLAPARALVGRSVTLDASSSSDEGAGITRYEFDTDGDGTFETDSRGSPSTTRSYNTPTTLTVGVRVTDATGLTATASAPLTVTVTPPVGRQLGVSINHGAQYTNDPNVTVFAVWPSFASDMLVSNDGGFEKPGFFPVAEQTPWVLDSSGPERLPKTIYVRFTSGPQISETFQDDIILDQTPPKVLGADIAPPVSQSVAAAAAAKLVTLRVKAKDNVSGVGRMQVTTNKKKPGKLLKYKKTLKVKPAPQLYVRVRDKAGNYSTWRAAKRR